jgi:hypothetical protein
MNAPNGWRGLNLTERVGYLERLAARKKRKVQKDRAAFGIMGGAFGFRYLYVVGGSDILWKILTIMGAKMLLLGIFCPAILSPLDRGYRAVANMIGYTVFRIVLILIYFVMIAPLGALVKRFRGSTPFYQWSEFPPEQAEGWTDKIIPEEADSLSTAPRSAHLLTQPLLVLAHFIRYQRFILLPVLLVLITVGLLMFFVASSTLAPFIYTLF